MMHSFPFLIYISAFLAAVLSESNITAPADFTMETCNPDTSPSRTGVPSWYSSSDCKALSASVISRRDSTSYISTGIWVNRLWTVKDGCNDTANQTQTINLIIPKLEFNLPKNVSTACSDTIHPNTTGLPSVVAQPCPDISITISYADANIQGSCPGSKQIVERKFTMKESFGRTALYQQTITLFTYAPPEVTCDSDGMHLLITRDNYPYLNPERMYLNDPSCNASSYNSSHVIFIIPLHSCGSVRRVSSDHMTFENKVVAPAGSSDDVTGYWDDVVFPVNCSYRRRVTVVGPSYTATRGKVEVEHEGLGNFTFSMQLYRSNLYDQPYQEADFPLSVSIRRFLYLEVKVESSQSQLHLFLDTCKARSSLSSNSVDYTFIKNGCPVDSSLMYNYQLSSRQRFSVRAFQFLSGQSTVYLQCEVLVCHVNDTSSRCTSGCQARRRRDVDQTDERPASGKTYTLSLGPLTKQANEPNQGSGTEQQDSYIVPAVIGAAGGIIMIALLCLAIVFVLRVLRRRRRRADLNTPPAQKEGRYQLGANPAFDVVE